MFFFCFFFFHFFALLLFIIFCKAKNEEEKKRKSKIKKNFFDHFHSFLNERVEIKGFEPLALALQRQCSTNWAIFPFLPFFLLLLFLFFAMQKKSKPKKWKKEIGFLLFFCIAKKSEHFFLKKLDHTGLEPVNLSLIKRAL